MYFFFSVIVSQSYPYHSPISPATAASVPVAPPPPPPIPPLELGEASTLAPPPPPPPYSCDPSGSDLPQGKWILTLGEDYLGLRFRKKS